MNIVLLENLRSYLNPCLSHYVKFSFPKLTVLDIEKEYNLVKLL